MLLHPLLCGLTIEDVRTGGHCDAYLDGANGVGLNHKLLLVRLVSQRLNAVEWEVLLLLLLLLRLLL